MRASPQVDGILADLGISTNQLFDPQYGLSFASPCRWTCASIRARDTTAADLVNQLPEKDLANVLYK